MYVYTILPRMTDTTTSQNIDISSWDTLCMMYVSQGCAIAEVVSRHLPTATGWVWSQVRLCWIYDGKLSLRNDYEQTQ
jgi:hypothetical protein